MLLFNFLIHTLSILLVFSAFLASAYLWWKHRNTTFYTQVRYWKYLTTGLFFLLVYTYADIYTPTVPVEQAFYVYMTGLLLFAGVVFIFIAVKRLIATQTSDARTKA